MVHISTSQTSAPNSQSSAETTSVMNYFVVMLEYPARYVDGVRISVAGREAIVDPEMTRREVISRLQSGEYDADEIAFIHHITMNDLPADVTADIIAEAFQPTFDRPNAADALAAKWDHAADHRKHGVAE